MTARRGRGEGSIFQRSDGRWVYQVPVGWNAGGTRKYRTVSATTKREVLAKRRALDEEIAAGTVADDPTVAEWVTYWIDNISPGRDTTRARYHSVTRTWIIPSLGKRTLRQLRPEHVRSMLKEMERQGKAGATRRQAYAILSASLNAAVKERRIAYTPLATVRAPQPDKGSHHGRLSLDEARKVIDALDGDPLASRWLAALLQGLRQGEALALRWEDVDLDARTVRVRSSAARVKSAGIVVGDVKSVSSERVVPMLEPLAWALEQLPHRDGYVWGQPKERDLRVAGTIPRRPEGDHKAWERLLERAGVRDYPLHSARETTGSLLMEAGVPDTVIQEILGHSNVRITRDAYLHGDDRLRREGMAALTELVFSVQRS